MAVADGRVGGSGQGEGDGADEGCSMFKNVPLGFNYTFILKAHSYDTVGSRALPGD